LARREFSRFASADLQSAAFFEHDDSMTIDRRQATNVMKLLVSIRLNLLVAASTIAMEQHWNSLWRKAAVFRLLRLPSSGAPIIRISRDRLHTFVIGFRHRGRTAVF